MSKFNAPFETAEGSHGHYVSVHDATGRTVARVPWGDGDGDLAQLFSSAPELLEVVRGFVLGCTRGELVGEVYFSQLLDKAQAALLKAEGK